MTIRKAALGDVGLIHDLLRHYAAQGELLARPLSKIYDHLRDFWIRESPDGGLAGCVALQFCWRDLAEIRSLAVHPDHRSGGIGRALVNRALEEAAAFHVERVFTLTYRPGFFEQLGFSIISRNDLPLKIWSDCLACVHFPNCNETAMMHHLTR